MNKKHDESNSDLNSNSNSDSESFTINSLVYSDSCSGSETCSSKSYIDTNMVYEIFESLLKKCYNEHLETIQKKIIKPLLSLILSKLKYYLIVLIILVLILIFIFLYILFKI